MWGSFALTVVTMLWGRFTIKSHVSLCLHVGNFKGLRKISFVFLGLFWQINVDQ